MASGNFCLIAPCCCIIGDSAELFAIPDKNTSFRFIFEKDCPQSGVFLPDNSQKMRKWTMEELGRKSIDEFRHAAKSPVMVLLDNIRSMHNVGSVFRTADAFLLQGIYLCGYTPQPPHRDIQKTALGATETVEWKHFPHASEGIADLKQQGYRIFGVEQAVNSIPLHKFPVSKDHKLAIIFGNEVTGISTEILSLCDGCVEIPQYGMKHSLNVSVACGIVLWEIVSRTLAE